MLNLSIMPLDENHIQEICDDIIEQQRSGASTHAMLMMKFNPEGTPVVNKAEKQCEIYDKYREILDKAGARHGVLVQATLGHIVVPYEPYPFQPTVSLVTGKEHVVQCCPYDPDFREYMKEQMRILASHHPSIIMIDDDMGLLYRDIRGCACKHHMAEFNLRAGTNMSREELYAHTLGNTEEDKYFASLYVDVQRDSLVGMARAMREGIDSVDPSIQGIVSGIYTTSFCEFSGDIAEVFAGKGNPRIMRMNGGPYALEGVKGFTRNIIRAAVLRENVKDKTDIFLAETDTSQAENAAAVSGLELTPDPVVQDKDGKDIVGSYAGADVPFGNDPDTKYGQNDWFYDTRYPRGYTWMRRPRRDKAPQDAFAVEFDVEDYNRAVSGGKDITLRMTQINNFTPDEVAIVAGYVPRKSENKNIPETLDYVLTQKYASGNEKLDSLFTTVFEPYKGERYIESIEAVTVSGNIPAGDMVRAVKIIHTDGKRIDYVVYATNNTEIYTVKDTDGTTVFNFRGFVGVYSVNAEGAVLYRYVNDGDIIDGAKDEPAAAVSEYTGTVEDCTELLSLTNYIDVNMQCDDLASLSGKYIYVNNDGKQNAVYRIDGAAPSPDEDGTIRLDIGMISPIRVHKNKDDVNEGYVYNVSQGQTFRIPMSYSEDYSPIISPVSDSLTVSAGSSIKVNVSAESPMTENAPAISYVGSTLPRGASVNSATGEITWKPDASQVGENHFAITARDADGRESTVHFTVTVYGSTTSKPSDEEENAEAPEAGTTDTPAGGGGGGGAAPTDKPDDKTDTSDEKDNAENTTKPNVGEGVPDLPNFADLGNHSWAVDAINALATDGIIKGTSANTFSPAANITRADFALLLVRAFDLTSDNAENFADVTASDYFAPELAIARNTGIVGGIGDNKYAPRNFITRQDMMVIVHRAMQKLDVGFGIYDEPQNADYAIVAEYAKPAVSALIGTGLVNGKNGRIAPTDYTTRAEVAVLIKRILDFIK